MQTPPWLLQEKLVTCFIASMTNSFILAIILIIETRHGNGICTYVICFALKMQWMLWRNSEAAAAVDTKASNESRFWIFPGLQSVSLFSIFTSIYKLLSECKTYNLKTRVYYKLLCFKILFKNFVVFLGVRLRISAIISLRFSALEYCSSA